MSYELYNIHFDFDWKVLTGIICQKFKKKFLLGGEDSKSSSEDGGEDGLFTATDVIKQAGFSSTLI